MKFKTNLILFLSLAMGLVPSASLNAYGLSNGKAAKLLRQRKPMGRVPREIGLNEIGLKKNNNTGLGQSIRQNNAKIEKKQVQKELERQKNNQKTEKSLFNDGILGAYVLPTVDNVTKLDDFLENQELPPNPYVNTVGQARKMVIGGATSMIGLGIASKLADSIGMNESINNYFENDGGVKHSLALAAGTAALAVPFLGYKSLSRNIATKFNTLWTFNLFAPYMPDVSDKIPEVAKSVYNSIPGKIASLPFKLAYKYCKVMVELTVNDALAGVIGVVPGMP